VAHAHLHRRAARGPRQRRRTEGQPLVAVVRVEQIEGVGGLPLLRPVAEHAGDRRAGVADGPVGRDDRDHVRRVLHQGAEALLAAARVEGLGEVGPVEGQRDLGGQDRQPVREGGRVERRPARQQDLAVPLAAGQRREDHRPADRARPERPPHGRGRRRGERHQAAVPERGVDGGRECARGGRGVEGHPVRASRRGHHDEPRPVAPGEAGPGARAGPGEGQRRLDRRRLDRAPIGRRQQHRGRPPQGALARGGPLDPRERRGEQIDQAAEPGERQAPQDHRAADERGDVDGPPAPGLHRQRRRAGEQRPGQERHAPPCQPGWPGAGRRRRRERAHRGVEGGGAPEHVR